MHSLVGLTDVYVSLHRSEGFGLIPAEAMSLGKPVVMTRWSGNLDLMTDDNCCGVDYKLIPVEANAWPYLPGQTWADPDVDQAAKYLRRLRDDAGYYSGISGRAARTIREKFSPQAVGTAIRTRLQALHLV
jgi:glycosyltransferase involved in cell wall biosynthesis